MCGGCSCGLGDDKPVNLYQVSVNDGEWCYFVFAISANRAKSICIHHVAEEEYIDLRVRTLKKNVLMVRKDLIIDDPYDEAYARVTELGFKYSDVDADGELISN